VETLGERIRRVSSEPIAIVPYDPRWPRIFEEEKAHLLSCLPGELIRRIEHYGSTAVPGLSAKPIIDMLVEVSDLGEVRRVVVPILEAQGYDYFWRPTHGDDGPPFYAWFIKRDPTTGTRTHHIHMATADMTQLWDGIAFRDYLRAHPDTAREYAALKRRYADEYPNDREGYTQAKTGFVTAVTARAREAIGE